MMMMTQTMIEQLNQEEYCHMLAYGDPVLTEVASSLVDVYSDEPFNTDGNASWISTLESTTYPDMTFGYIATL